MDFFKVKKEELEVNTELEAFCSRLDSIEKRIETIQTSHNVILEQLNKIILNDNSISKFNGRLEDLELWKAKIHNLMVGGTPIKKEEKITRFGRSIMSRL